LLNCEARLVRNCCQPAARQESDLLSNQADELIYPAWSVPARFKPNRQCTHRAFRAARAGPFPDRGWITVQPEVVNWSTPATAVVKVETSEWATSM